MKSTTTFVFHRRVWFFVLSGILLAWGISYNNCGNTEINDVAEKSSTQSQNPSGLNSNNCFTGPNNPCTPKVVTGLFHTCILLNGEVECAGYNDFGQLGNGTIGGSFNTFQKVQGLKDVKDIEAGRSHTCVIQNNGIKCWGNNQNGQLGNGSISPIGIPTPTAVTGIASNAIQLSLAGSHSCALMSGGNIKCWGENTPTGQLGNGSSAPSYTPVTVSNINGMATYISAGPYNSCAVLNNGKIRCWGGNVAGELGIGSLSPTYSQTPILVPGITTATQVSVGNHTVCALLANQTVQCWGSNVVGGVGASSPDMLVLLPTPVASLTSAIQIMSMNNHSCAIKSNGDVKCWGDNSSGQLGNGVTSTTPLYAAVKANIANVAQIAVGGLSSCAVLTNDKVQCWGANQFGQLGDGTFNSPALAPIATSTAQLTCATCSWQPMNSVNAPTPRQTNSNHASAIWTGTKMIVWGENDGVTVLGDGGMYDPVTNVWTTMSNIGAPSPRTGHVTVWTGSKMIVWGGMDFVGNYFTDGALFDPNAGANGSWTSITNTNAPPAMLFGTAVWAGAPINKMIVYGNNGGGMYDPVTDSWSTISTVGAPSSRYSHVAVWTGSRMVVWGGAGAAGYYSDGAMYNPATNKWTSMTNTNAPLGRAGATVVWTGTQMIVFGGLNNNNPLNSGGRFNPVTNVWHPMNTTGIGTMAWHSAVWTGSKMIVWGNGSALYDPSTDQWANLCMNNSPAMTHDLFAVWTGYKMIVWGGTNGSSAVNTGGMYIP